MQDWPLWDVVPVTESWSVMGKAPLQGKLVNKGDLEKPVVRSRFVAKEFANTKSDDFFSTTPLLEALRLLLSRAFWEVVKHWKSQDLGSGHPEGTLSHICRTTLVSGTAARGLRRSLHGTRDAPAKWEAFLSKQMESVGFARGLASSCCYRSKDVSCVVHGDDFGFASNRLRRASLSRSLVASEVTNKTCVSSKY